MTYDPHPIRLRLRFGGSTSPFQGEDGLSPSTYLPLQGGGRERAVSARAGGGLATAHGGEPQ